MAEPARPGAVDVGVGSPRPQIHCQPSTSGSVPKGRQGYLWLKRLGDIIVSSLLLVVATPLFIMLALLVKLDSPGPALFAQQRMGYDWRRRQQRPFWFYKFRSMYHHSDQSIHQEHVRSRIQAQRAARVSPGAPSPAPLSKLAHDPRITRVGRVLRRTSLDELPQLWNVLKGDMSLVGPRPVPLYEVAEYEAWHERRLRAMPGMTGLWQVKGRGQVSIDDMARLDIEYIERQSLWLDLQILILTIPAVLSGKGAG